MRQIYPNIFQVKIPLRGNPLKELNCHIVKGERRNLIIDTGFNQPEGRELLLAALGQAGCAPDDTDVFITHLHVDHSGLVGAVKTERNRAYASAYDAAAINAAFRLVPEGGEALKKNPRYEMMGFTAQDGDVGGSHPALRNRVEREISFTAVAEGDRIDLGGFCFEVVEFPGHTPGLVGLYERSRKILFPGDHILGKITPNITFWSFDFDALGVYIQSLRKARAMAVDYLFPGHRFYVEDHAVRINQLLAHHDRRLLEVRELIKREARTAYEVAAGMRWDFGGGNFLDFPVAQKFFAAGEAMAHLEHLVFLCEAERLRQGPILYYKML